MKLLLPFIFQFGLIGIVEEEWIATLSTIDPDDITFLHFVEESKALAQELRDQVQICSLISDGSLCIKRHQINMKKCNYFV